jgi:ATP-dependent 26S proteasome regulatory subunit
MEPSEIERTRAANLWGAFERKFQPLAKASRFEAAPALDFDRIGGLDAAKDEILTYACGASNPDVYRRWGTAAPSALLLVGPAGAGKTLLAEALATQTRTPFLCVAIPRLVLQVVHSGGNAAELLNAWVQLLTDMPSVTVFFQELEFAQADLIGGPRPDLPVGPVMDFLLELVDRTIEVEQTLVIGSTSNPETLRRAFLAPDRFERAVEVNPVVPDDIVAALRIHAADAEKRAARTLFRGVDWDAVVRQHGTGSIGDWVRLLHAVLRTKARCEEADGDGALVTTQDLLSEVERFKRVTARLPASLGRYL